ncbi:hypothetical protein BU15DRAFT_76568 [Melanogaster broomeanus]|nr:hypothetical protein BU15DRAFT_76568 [Melanogaster broomeanus]
MSDLGFDVPTDYGPLILGGLVAFALSGCVNMQFIVYWQIYPEETWPTKLLVVVMWLLDLCHSGFVAVAIWASLITHYGDMGSIDVIPWSVGPTVEVTAMVTFLVQSFFAYRIYRLHKHKWTVAGPVAILAFIRLVAASVSMSEMIRLKSYSAFVNKPFPSWVFTTGLSLSALVDIIITVFLCYFLRSGRSSVPSTNRLIDTLTLYTVQNGSATCLGAIGSLICALAAGMTSPLSPRGTRMRLDPVEPTSREPEKVDRRVQQTVEAKYDGEGDVDAESFPESHSA